MQENAKVLFRDRPLNGFHADSLAAVRYHSVENALPSLREQMRDEACSLIPQAVDGYSSSAPSSGSSAASIFESLLMLVAWISAIRCLKLWPSTSSSTSRYLRVPSRVMS